MKIGIITLPLNNNYGGILQAFALKTILMQLGHKPTLIMRRQNIRHKTLNFKVKYALKRVIQSIIYRKRLSILFKDVVDFNYKGKYLKEFIDKNLSPMTPFLYSTEELSKAIQGKFDAIVVGSDQVWRPDYVNCISNMFLDFAETWKIRRISYAASFGSDHVVFTDEQTKQFGSLFSKFDAVSFREKSAIHIVDELKWSNKEIHTTLDPTMLLGREYYQKIVGKSKSKLEQPYIFVYVLDNDNYEEVQTIISFVENETGFRVQPIIDVKQWKRIDYVMPPIEKWLGGLLYSSFVITDSFHGTVFSLLFNKPFITYTNPNRGLVRIKDLLNDYGLENRIIGTSSDVRNINLLDIDWNNINSILAKKKEESLNYLRKVL